MVHERDGKYDVQDDGEYHFSDDQANYEMEPEVVKLPTPDKSTPKSSGGGISSLISQYRRPLIGGVVLIFLIFLVSRILAPATSAPPATDFAQNSGSTDQVTAEVRRQPAKVANASPIQAENQAFNPLPQPLAMSGNSPTSRAANAQLVAPTSIAAPATTTTTTTVYPASAAVVPQAVQQFPEQATTVQQQPAADTISSAPAQSSIDKLIALEEQNAKIISQIQTETAQKLADNDAQSIAVQEKLQDFTMRIASVETALSRLGKSMQDVKAPASISTSRPLSGPSDTVAEVVARPTPEIKSSYTVQAIIPGRAWLKSDAGDTITVAEGDILKKIGRIIKIDPYDGVVQIDNGGKLITLSYGVNSE